MILGETRVIMNGIHKPEIDLCALEMNMDLNITIRETCLLMKEDGKQVIQVKAEMTYPDMYKLLGRRGG